jgi:hypothetical protein
VKAFGLALTSWIIATTVCVRTVFLLGGLVAGEANWDPSVAWILDGLED